jgi:hypothetical protein
LVAPWRVNVLAWTSTVAILPENLGIRTAGTGGELVPGGVFVWARPTLPPAQRASRKIEALFTIDFII